MSDTQCKVYIDNNYKGIAYKDEMLIIPLCRGEFLVTMICVDNPIYEFRQVISLQYDKIERFIFNNRVKDSDIVYSADSKCYKNIILQQNITKSIYDEGRCFVNGFAKVKKGNKWGCIDKLGNEVIRCEYIDEALTLKCNYDSIGKFCRGRARVRRGRYYGIVDEKYNEIVPCRFDYISEPDIKYDCGYLRTYIEDCNYKDGGQYGIYDYMKGEEIEVETKSKSIADFKLYYLRQLSPYFSIRSLFLNYK